MGGLKGIKNVKEKVDYLLTNYPHTRDSDEKLIANIWNIETPGIIDKDTFLKVLSEGRLSSPKSIITVRQNLQQYNPQLRGKKWLERQQKHNPEVRQTVKKNLFDI